MAIFTFSFFCFVLLPDFSSRGFWASPRSFSHTSCFLLSLSSWAFHQPEKKGLPALVPCVSYVQSASIPWLPIRYLFGFIPSVCGLDFSLKSKRFHSNDGGQSFRRIRFLPFADRGEQLTAPRTPGLGSLYPIVYPTVCVRAMDQTPGRSMEGFFLVLLSFFFPLLFFASLRPASLLCSFLSTLPINKNHIENNHIPIAWAWYVTALGLSSHLLF